MRLGNELHYIQLISIDMGRLYRIKAYEPVMLNLAQKYKRMIKNSSGLQGTDHFLRSLHDSG